MTEGSTTFFYIFLLCLAGFRSSKQLEAQEDDCQRIWPQILSSRLTPCHYTCVITTLSGRSYKLMRREPDGSTCWAPQPGICLNGKCDTGEAPEGRKFSPQPQSRDSFQLHRFRRSPSLGSFWRKLKEKGETEMSGLRERLTLLKEQQARQGESLKEKVTEATTTLGEYLKDKLKDATDSVKSTVDSFEGGIEHMPHDAHGRAFGESLAARAPVPPGIWGMTNATEIPEAWLRKNTGIEQSKTGVNGDAGRGNRAGHFPNRLPVGKLGPPALINREITAETPSLKGNTKGDPHALTFESPRNYGSPVSLDLQGNRNQRLDERTKGAGTSTLDQGTSNESQISSEFADERDQHSSMFSKSQSKSHSINASPYSDMYGFALPAQSAETNGTLKNGDTITVHKPPPLESLPKPHIYVKGNEAHVPTERYRSSSGIGARTFMPSSIPWTSALSENLTSTHTRPHNDAAGGIRNENYNAETSYSYEHNDTHSTTLGSAPLESDSNFFAEQTPQKGTLTRTGTYLTGDGFRTTTPLSSANIWPNVTAHANQNVAAKQWNEARAHKPYLSMESESLLGHQPEVEHRQPYQHYAPKPNITFRSAFIPHIENNQPSDPYTSHVGLDSDRRLQSAFSSANGLTHATESSFTKEQKAPARTAHSENLSTGALFKEEGRVLPGELPRSHEPGGYVPLSNTTNFTNGNVLPDADHMTNFGAKANALPRSTLNWRNAPTTATKNTFVATPNQRAVIMYQNNLEAATSEMKEHYAKMSDSRLLDVNHNLSAVLYSHREGMPTVNYTTGIHDRDSTRLSSHGSWKITSAKNNFANPQNQQAGEIPRESTITGAPHSPENNLLRDKMIKPNMAKYNPKFPPVMISPKESHERATLDSNNNGLRGTPPLQPPITTVQNDTAAFVSPERISGDVSLKSVHKAENTSHLSEIKSRPKTSNTGLAVGIGVPQNAGEHSELSPKFATTASFPSFRRQKTSSDLNPAFEKSSSAAREPQKELLAEAKTYRTNMPTDISSAIMKPVSESRLQRNGEVASNKDNTIMPSKLLSPKGTLKHSQYSTPNTSAASKHVSEHANAPYEHPSMNVKGEKSGVTSNSTGLRRTPPLEPPITTLQNDTAAFVSPERLSADVSLELMHKAGNASSPSEIKLGPKASNTGLAVGIGMPQNAGENLKLSPNFSTTASFPSLRRQITSSDVQPAIEKSPSGAREPPKKSLAEAKSHRINMPTDISNSIMKPVSESTLKRNGGVASNKDNSIMPSKLPTSKGTLEHSQYSAANASAVSKHVSEYANTPYEHPSVTVKGEKSAVTSSLPVTHSSREAGEFHTNFNLTNVEQKDQGQPINGALPSKVPLSTALDVADKLKPVLRSRTNITATGNKPPGNGLKVSIGLEAPRSLLKTTKSPTTQVLPSEKSSSKVDQIQFTLHEPPTPKAAHPNPGNSLLRSNVNEKSERGPLALDYFEPTNTPIRTVLTTKDSECSNLNVDIASGDQASRTKEVSRFQAKPAAELPRNSLQTNMANAHEASEVYTKRGNQAEEHLPSESSTIQNNASVFDLSMATTKSAPTIINMIGANHNAAESSIKKTVLSPNGLVQPGTGVTLTLPEEETEGKNVAVNIEQHSPHLAQKTPLAAAAAQKTTSKPAINNTSRNLENLSGTSGTSTQSPKQRFNEHVKTRVPQPMPELHTKPVNVVAEIQPSSLSISPRTSASVAPALRTAMTSASPPVSALAKSENSNAPTEAVTQLPGEQAAKISSQTRQPSFGIQNTMPEVLSKVPDVAEKMQEHSQRIPEMTLLSKISDLKGTTESATLPSPPRAQDMRASITTIARLPKKPPALVAEEVSQPKTEFEQTSPQTLDTRTYVVAEGEPPAASASERVGASLPTVLPVTTESTMHQFSPMFEESNVPIDRAEISKSPSALHSLYLIYGNTLVSPVSLPVLIESDMNTFPKRPYELLCEIRPGFRDYYSSTLIERILASRMCPELPKWYPTTAEHFLRQEIENNHDSMRMSMNSLAIQEARRGMRGLDLPLNALAVYDYLTPRRRIAARRTQSESHHVGQIDQDSRYAYPRNIREMTLLLPRIHVKPPKWHPKTFAHVIGEEVVNGKELWKAWNFLPTIKPGVRHFVSPISTYSQITSRVFPRGTDASWMPGTSSFSRKSNLDSRYMHFSDILARKLVLPPRYATFSPRYPKSAERLVLPEVMNGNDVLAERQFLPFITKK